MIDDKGFLYVASELEKFTERSKEVGQLMKLNPFRKKNPVVWSIPVTETGFEGSGGLWSTPALDRGMLYVSTNAGGLLGVDRKTGHIRWKIPLPGPTWASPVVVDNVLIEGDCSGWLHAWDVSQEGQDAARALAAQGRRRLHRVDARGLARLDLGGDARRRDVRDQRSGSGEETRHARAGTA